MFPKSQMRAIPVRSKVLGHVANGDLLGKASRINRRRKTFWSKLFFFSSKVCEKLSSGKLAAGDTSGKCQPSGGKSSNALSVSQHCECAVQCTLTVLHTVYRCTQKTAHYTLYTVNTRDCTVQYTAHCTGNEAVCEKAGQCQSRSKSRESLSWTWRQVMRGNSNCNPPKYILHFGQIHLAFWTNTLCILDKYIVQLRQCVLWTSHARQFIFQPSKRLPQTFRQQNAFVKLQNCICLDCKSKSSLSWRVPSHARQSLLQAPPKRHFASSPFTKSPCTVYTRYVAI